MRCVGRTQGDGDIQPVGDGIVPYVKVYPDGIVRSTEDMAGEGEDAIGM